jgi:hypothetical protein
MPTRNGGSSIWFDTQALDLSRMTGPSAFAKSSASISGTPVR